MAGDDDDREIDTGDGEVALQLEAALLGQANVQDQAGRQIGPLGFEERPAVA